MDILDVGCGNGWFLQRALKPGRHCDGVDTVDTIEDKTGIRFFKESFVDFVPDRKYDLIFARNVFFQEQGQLDQARRYASYLKPGGVMAVSFLADDDPWVTEGTVKGEKYYGVTKNEVVEFQKGFETLWSEEFADEFPNKDGKVKYWHWYQLIIKNL